MPVLAAQTSSLPEICGEAAFFFKPQEKESFAHELRVSCFDESRREN